MTMGDSPTKSLENPQAPSFSSAGFVYDTQRGTLFFDKVPVKLSPLLTRIIELLLSHGDSLVTRQKLFDSIWPNQIVSDDALTRAMSDLRKSLAQFSEQKLIETLPKRGYRWLEPVTMNAETSQDLTGLSVAAETFKSEPSSKRKIGERPHTEALRSVRFPLKQLPLWAMMLISLIIAMALLLTAVKSFELRIKRDFVPIAIVSGAGVDKQSKLYSQVENEIKQLLLNTETLRYLASDILVIEPTEHNSNNLLAKISNRATVDWMLMIDIDENAPNQTLHFSLIEASTGLVHYSKKLDLSNSKGSSTQFNLQVVNDIERFVQ